MTRRSIIPIAPYSDAELSEADFLRPKRIRHDLRQYLKRLERLAAPVVVIETTAEVIEGWAP